MNRISPSAGRLELSPPPPIRRSWLLVGWWSLAFALAAALAIGYAYYSIFSLFQSYDDEGFVLISLKSFFQGKPLYDQVYSSFQPGFYVVVWALFKTLGVPLSHDSMRLATLILWVAGAGLNGLITWRLKGSRLLALFVAVVSARFFELFANEPGHPQTLACVLVALAAALFAFADSLRPRVVALALGALTGLLLLIKINIGIFLLLPAGLMLLSIQRGRAALWLKLPGCLLMLVLPWFLWRGQLAAPETPLRVLCLLEAMALVLVWARLVAWRRTVALVVFLFLGCEASLYAMNSYSVAALPVFSVGLLTLSICAAVLMYLDDPGDSTFDRQSWCWAMLGCGLVCASVFLVVFLRGTTLHGLVDGILLWPARLSTLFVVRMRSNWLGAWLGLAGAAACYGYLSFRGRCAERPWFKATLVVGQLLFGVAVLAEFYHRVPGSARVLPLHYDLPHFWMLPFAWLVAVRETGPQETRTGRLALLLVVVMQPLIACPVAGTQLVPASILILVLGAVCLANGLRACPFPVGRLTFWARWRLAAGIAGALLVLIPFWRETVQRSRYYASLTPLNLPGAARIRLPEQSVRDLRGVVSDLARPEVDTFISLPGMNSFYLWAQKEPPTGLNVSSWMIVMEAEAQERIWRAAEAHPGLLAIRNQALIRTWMKGHSIAQLPLVRHINEDFKPVHRYGAYEVLARQSR